MTFQVHLAALDLPADEVARLAAFLATDERDRAAAFRFDRDRRRFVVRRGRLRELLAAEATPPDLRPARAPAT